MGCCGCTTGYRSSSGWNSIIHFYFSSHSWVIHRAWIKHFDLSNHFIFLCCAAEQRSPEDKKQCDRECPGRRNAFWKKMERKAKLKCWSGRNGKLIAGKSSANLFGFFLKKYVLDISGGFLSEVDHCFCAF